MNNEQEKHIFIAKQEIASILGIAMEDIKDDGSPIALGIDSMTLMRLAFKLKKRSITITFTELIALKTFAEWWTAIRGSNQATDNSECSDVEDYSFALAPMQNAYVLGRSPGQPLGGVAAHFYEEFDGTAVEPVRLEAAIKQVISRHSMLRLAVSPDGRGRIMAQSPWEKLKINDFRTCSYEEAEKELLLIREKLSGWQLNIEDGEVLDISLSLLPGNDFNRNPTRLHVNLEMVAADAMSLRIIMKDLARAYEKETGKLEPLKYSFPRYLADRENLRNMPEAKLLHEGDKEYWNKKLDDLPLPLSFGQNNEKLAPVTRRRAFWLEKSRYEQFAKYAQRQELTPAMAFAAAFAETVGAYSDQDTFLLNVPLFNRENFHPEVAELVGDFTSSILASWRGRGSSFADRARGFQAEFRSDAAHARYSGLELLRDMTRRRGERVFAPVVYTSAIGLGELFSEEVMKNFGNPVWIISQGPQVELDAQVTQVQGGVLVNWDAREDILSSQLLDAMFAGFQRLIGALADSQEVWNQTFVQIAPGEQIELRESINMRARVPVPDRGIHETFFREAGKRGNDPAVCWGTSQKEPASISHRSLAQQALAMAGSLVELGIKRGDRVVVSLSKGPEQVIALLAILAAGGTYVPVGIAAPEERRGKIIATVRAKALIDAHTRLPDAAPLTAPVPVSGSDSAYILFTSGSTGDPKGVEVSHAAALNTILALNRVFEMGKKDRSLSVSSLEFDLSVYDIFGLLEAGGAVVIPIEGESRNGEAWLDLIDTHQITLLNCAPILLDILLAATAEHKQYGNLNKVLLGGDRVPADVYTRLRKAFGLCRIAGLGGTTETAIHSTLFEVKDPLPEGTSVPYGWPLDGVECRVVDSLGRDCPDGIAGELWIGGNSVANGYINDSELTEKKFLFYEGKRWYRTGDRVRYLPGACLEFLGRIDNQLKIKGQRVEIGEVENALEGDQGISRAAVACVRVGPSYRLASVIAPVFQPTCEPGERLALAADQESIEEHGLQHRVVRDFLSYLLSTNSKRNGTPVQRLWEEWLERQCDTVAEGWPLELAMETWIEPIAQRLSEKAKSIWAISQGESDPLSLLEDEVLSPGYLLSALPDTENALKALSSIIGSVSERNGSPIKVLEIGSLGGSIAKRLIAMNPNSIFKWTVFDKSKKRVELACRTIGNISAGIVAKDDLVEAVEQGEFDVVVALGTLHTMKGEISRVIRTAAIMSKPGAPILALEMSSLPPLGLISAALLENGFSAEGPADAGYKAYVKDKAFWQKTFEKNNVTGVVNADMGRLCIIGGRLPESKANLARLRLHLEKVLPEVMRPSNIFIAPEIALNKNGKIDRKKIASMLNNSLALQSKSLNRSIPKPSTTEEAIAGIWQELLAAETVYLEDDFFSLGGDSLVATQFVFRARQAGYHDAALSILFAHPTLQGFSERLRPPEHREQRKLTLLPNEEDRYLPFPCTAVQRAYLIGRRSDFALGGVGTHVYNEFDSTCLDIPRLELALNRLVNRHEMLRAIFDDAGMQRILAFVPTFSVVQITGDFCEGDAVQKLRNEMSHQVFDVQKWPLFDVRAIHYSDRQQQRRTRLGISLDNIVADGLSMMITLTELSDLYENPEVDLDQKYGPSGVSFRDYVLATLPNEISLADSRMYWKNRVETLPPPPNLPLCINPDELSVPTFVRRQTIISKDEWRNLAERGKIEGVTVPTIILGAYGEALATWSGQAGVSLTVTLFDRFNLHPDINRVVGDFTALLIAGYEAALSESWSSVLGRMQKQLWSDLDHRELPISDVLKLMPYEDGTPRVSIPVIFTGAMGVSGSYSMADQASYGERVFTLSQTPQIWMDLQIREVDLGIEVALDAVEEIFPPGVVDGLFETIGSTIRFLSRNSWENPLGGSDGEVKPIADTSYNCLGNNEGKTLHKPFFHNANRFPDKTALLYGEEKISYSELKKYSLRIAGELIRRGVKRNDRVVVSLPRGIDQIAVVLGILAAGGVFVPVSINQPAERMKDILKDVTPTVVVDSMELFADTESTLPSPLDMPDDSSAYIIFTSGSTGKPKGVEISHAAARNTIDEVIANWNICDSDVILNVSALDFDLSVFDIFGLLSVGGSVVLIDEEQYRDPEAWCDLISRHGISIWNSAPALLEMLITVAWLDKKWETLRLALVSGDWIPLDLPNQWYEISAGANSIFVALGGATEASIWSNSFEVKEVSDKWNSIPYGTALSGQKYRIVDERGKECPPWVTGELWIGGVGLAKGYINSPEMTAQKFVLDASGMRWYKTGDMGRFWQNGTIEFLGRKDTQVKIRGHRIELGEIESALRLHPGIEEAVVVAYGDKYHKVLNAFYSGKELSADELSEHLSRYLPQHSIPHSYHYLTAIPLTANGKVNRKQLELIAEEKMALRGSQSEVPGNEKEKIIASLWQEILATEINDRHVNIFSLGADSLSATRFIERLRREYEISLPLKEVFSHPTVSGLALAINRHSDVKANIPMEEGEL